MKLICSLFALSAITLFGAEPAALIKGTGPGWRAMTEADFTNVNCKPDTYTTTPAKYNQLKHGNICVKMFRATFFFVVEDMPKNEITHSCTVGVVLKITSAYSRW